MRKKRFLCEDSALVKSRRAIKQLEESLQRQTNEIERLEKENEKLKNENEKLKKELRSLRQPPYWAKPNKSAEVKKRAKKKGPKKGHAANIRKVPEHIDREVNLFSKECGHCHNLLPKPHKWHSHIQIDLPPETRVITTRYHVGWSYCSHCKKEVSTKDKLSYSRYGPRLHAQVCHWKYSLGLTLGKISKCLKDQYGLDISTGELSEIVSRSAKIFNSTYQDLGTSLMDQPQLYIDETGWRKDGDNRWLWSFSNKDVSYYKISESRGSKVVRDVLGESFNGVIVSDFYNAYNQIDSIKQKCWTHLLRKMRELQQRYPKNSEIHYFSRRLKYFYKRALKLKKKFNEGIDIRKYFLRLQTNTENFVFKKHRHRELKKIAKRIWKYRNEFYTFIKTGTDGTNNNAEREIRPAVLMRKTSYCNRSDQGVNNQEVLMSMVRTAQKRDQNFVSMATQYLQKS